MLGKMRRDEPGTELATDELRVFQQAGEQALIALHAQQHAVLHRPQQLAPGFFAGGAVGDDLAQHRVIERADCLAFDQAMVDPHAALQRRLPGGDAAGLWEKTLGRVFGVQAHFHGMAVELHLLLSQRQRQSFGDVQLPGHQIEAGDQFGHRVFHLQPGVHLQKVKLPARIQQELHGASADVIHRATRLERRFAHGLAQLGGHHRAGRFLDDFLMATLDRTVALAKVDQVAVLVAEQLNLDVTRVDQRLFEDQFVTAKPMQRFGAGGAESAPANRWRRAPGACHVRHRRHWP